MKTLIVTVVTAALALSAGAQTIRERERVQHKRIVHGVRSGELSRQETRQLERKEAQLHRQIQRDRADGLGLTPKERLKIEKKQDHLSRQIYKQKHDRQTR